MSTLLIQVRKLLQRVEALSGLQTVVGEQAAEIRELRALLARRPESEPVSMTLRRGPGEEWGVFQGKRKGKSVSPSHIVTETRNSFSVLEDLCADAENTRKTDETTLSSGKVVVVGDSQVRGLGKVLSSRGGKRWMSVCLPGAGVGDVVERSEGVLAGEGVAPTVCISAGGNDIGRVRPQELLRRLRQALERVRDLGGIPVLCGILPRKYVGARWWSDAAAVNRHMADHCRRNGWLFINNWNYFFGKDHLYTRDGVHLSEQGTGAMAWSLQRDLRAWGFLGKV